MVNFSLKMGRGPPKNLAIFSKKAGLYGQMDQNGLAYFLGVPRPV